MIQGRDRAKGRRAVGVDGLPRRAGTGAGWRGAMDESACRHSIVRELYTCVPLATIG